jgi:transposase InsO family protein
VKFAAISAEKAHFPVAWMCRQFSVSKSGYYAWLLRPQASRQTANEELLEAIKRVRASKHCSSYGSPRVHRALRERGLPAGRHRVARLMRLHGICAQAKRRRVKTTDSDHQLRVADNLLDRQFTASAPNQKWLGDISYIATEEGWLYLAIVLDLFARRVVGWAMDDNMRTQLVSRALDMATETRKPPPGLLYHSDRGSQYASDEFQGKLQKNAMICSMSRKAECWDNAPMESFFGTLKQELVYRTVYKTRKEAISAIFEYIEVFYNRQRLHSTLGFMAPAEYEEISASQALAA